MKIIGVFCLSFLLTVNAALSQTLKIDSLKQVLESDQLSTIERIKVNNDLGFEFWIIDPNQSISYGNKALAISVKEDFPPGKAYADRVIGVGHWATGNYEPALKHLYSSKETYERLDDSVGIANCIMNIGMVYADQNDITTALDHFLTANEIFVNQGEDSRVATTYSKIADIYILQKEFDKASDILKKAYNMHNNADFTYGKAESLNRLGLLYKAMGRKKDGIIHLKISALLSEGINDLDGLAKTYENIASIYIELKEYDNALEYALKAEEVALNIKSLKWLSNIYLDLKLIHQAKGNYKKSIDYYDKHILYKDSIFNEAVAKDISNLHSRIESEKHEAQLILDKQEIELLEEKSKVNQLMAVLGISSLVLLAIIAFLIIRTQKLKMIKNKKRSQEKQDELQRELEAKGQELTAYTVNFIRKNELLEELKDEIQQIKASANEDISSKVTKLGKIVDTHQQVDRDWEDFKLHFESVHKDFFVKLKSQNSSLTSNDLRLCALIRLNLTMKEMGQMLGISAESVKTARYRLRKKLDLVHEENLTDYLIKLDENIPVS